MGLMQKLMLYIVTRQWKNMAKRLRKAGAITEAEAFEEAVRTTMANPNRSPEEVIFQEKLKLIHKGKHAEALKYEDIAEAALPHFFGRSVDRDQIKPVPSTLQHLGNTLKIWIVSFLIGFVLVYFSAAPQGVNPDTYSAAKRILAFLTGGYIAIAISFVYIVWMVCRVLRNYQIEKNKVIREMRDKLRQNKK